MCTPPDLAPGHLSLAGNTSAPQHVLVHPIRTNAPLFPILCNQLIMSSEALLSHTWSLQYGHGAILAKPSRHTWCEHANASAWQGPAPRSLEEEAIYNRNLACRTTAGPLSQPTSDSGWTAWPTAADTGRRGSLRLLLLAPGCSSHWWEALLPYALHMRSSACTFHVPGMHDTNSWNEGRSSHKQAFA